MLLSVFSLFSILNKDMRLMYKSIFYDLPRGLNKARKLSLNIGKYELDESQGGPSNSDKRWWSNNVKDNIVPILGGMSIFFLGGWFITKECSNIILSYILGFLCIFCVISAIIVAKTDKE